MSVLMRYEKPSSNHRKRLVIKNSTLSITDLDGNLLESYQLRPISPAQIRILRMHNSSFCLIKRNNKYWFTLVPKTFSLSGITLNHFCTNCSKCYAKSDIDGGCARIRDLSLSSQETQDLKKAVELSERIEKYPFITLGIEVFGTETKNEALVVMTCENFVKDIDRPRKSRKEVDELLYSLYLFCKDGASEEEFKKNRKQMKGYIPSLSGKN